MSEIELALSTNFWYWPDHQINTRTMSYGRARLLQHNQLHEFFKFFDVHSSLFLSISPYWSMMTSCLCILASWTACTFPASHCQHTLWCHSPSWKGEELRIQKTQTYTTVPLRYKACMSVLLNFVGLEKTVTEIVTGCLRMMKSCHICIK